MSETEVKALEMVKMLWSRTASAEKAARVRIGPIIGVQMAGGQKVVSFHVHLLRLFEELTQNQRHPQQVSESL